MSLIINSITSPQTAELVQNSAFQVLSEGCLKAIGRPVFTLNDKTANKKEKRYSASREFVYQSLAMFSYFLLIFPVRKQTYKLLKHLPQFKNCPDLKNIKNYKQFENMMKNMQDKLMKTKLKGAGEFISIIASGVILTILTPIVLNKVLHPIMRMLNIEDMEKPKK